MCKKFKLYDDDRSEFDVHYQGLWDGETLCGVFRESEDPGAGKFDESEETDEEVDCYECLDLIKHVEGIIRQRRDDQQKQIDNLNLT